MYRLLHHMIKDHTQCSQTPQSQLIQLFSLSSVECLHNPYLGHGKKNQRSWWLHGWLSCVLPPRLLAWQRRLLTKGEGALNRKLHPLTLTLYTHTLATSLIHPISPPPPPSPLLTYITVACCDQPTGQPTNITRSSASLFPVPCSPSPQEPLTLPHLITYTFTSSPPTFTPHTHTLCGVQWPSRS